MPTLKLPSHSHLAVVFLLFAGTGAQAGVIFSDLGAPGSLYDWGSAYLVFGSMDPNYPVGYSGEKAASFTPGVTDTVVQLDLALGYGYSTGAEVTVSLDSDSGGTPGTALESWDADVLAPLNPGFPIVTLLSPLPVTVTGGSQYWLVVGPATETTDVGWANAGDGQPSVVPGTTTAYNNDGSGWVDAPFSEAFDVLDSATSTPEPGSIALLSIGLIIVSLLTCARRRGLNSRSSGGPGGQACPEAGVRPPRPELPRNPLAACIPGRNP